MNVAETTNQGLLRQRDVPSLPGLPRPVYARVENLRHRTATRPHSHPWLQLSYASRGVLQIRTAEGLFLAPPQWAILVPPALEHAVVNTAHTEMRSLYIDASALPDTGPVCQVLAVSDLLREMIRHFSGLPVEYEEGGAQGRLVTVMLDLMQAADRVSFSLPWPPEGWLRDLCEAMLATPQRPLRRADWCCSMGISIRTLERLFQRDIGMNMREWRLRARLLHALPLLEKGDSVTDVALACGYASTSSFIASFRRFFGATPGSFAAAKESR